MKLTKLSFLFYCFIILFIFQKNTYSQDRLIQKDSTDYFYKLLRSAKKSDDYLKVHRFYSKRKEQSYFKKDTLFMIYNLRFLASVERKLGQFEDSEATAIEALKLIENFKDGKEKNESKLGVLNHLGLIARKLEQFDRAIEFYNEALPFALESFQKNSIQNNIGTIYKLQGRYDLAVRIFEIVHKQKSLTKDSVSIARSLDNLGYSQYKNGMLEVGFSNMSRALDIRIKENHLDGISHSYLSLSEYYKDAGKNDIAIDYVNKAYAISKSMNDVLGKVKCLSYIIDLKSTPKVAEYKKLTDSISRAKQLSENKYASYKYNYTEEKRKADEAKLELVESKLINEKQEKVKWLLQLSTFFVIIISVLLYFLFKDRHKKEKIEQVYLTEARISKKVHDEVANDMYLIMNKMQKNEEPMNKIIDDVEKVYFKTRDISKENSAIDLSNGFENLINDLLLTYKDEDINVLTMGLSKVDWNVISDLKKTIIYRVLQELMVNMKKHSEASIVAVTFSQTDKKTQINYNDNGIGSNLKKSGGLVNVENRIHSINGSIIFTSEINNGFKAEITI